MIACIQRVISDYAFRPGAPKPLRSARCYVGNMQIKRNLLRAAGLTLLPVALIFPVLALARFGPTGPATVWPVAIYAPIAMWIETRALRILLNTWSDGRERLLVAILPLGLIAVFVYVVHAAVFILGLPGLIKHLF
jgi:hypothetical protein